MLKFLPFLACFAFTTSFSQVTITESDMPSAGDTLRYSVAANAIGISPMDGGTNQNWDFSNLQSASQYVDDFVSVSSTPFTYVAVFGLPFSPAASDMARIDNSAFQIPEIPVVNISVEDVYNFYKSNSDAYEQKGFGASINGFPLPITYSDPDVLIPLPLSQGVEQSSSYSFNATIPTLGYYGRDAERTNTVDGSGTLVTPFGTFDAIRMRSELVYTDSVAIDALGFGIQLPELTEIKYKWFAQGYGWPLLEITANSFFGVETVSRVVYRDNVEEIDDTSVEDFFTQNPVLLYPNPTSGILNFKFYSPEKADMQIEILDLTGRTVYSKSTAILPGDNFNVIPLHALNVSAGSYFLKLSKSGNKPSFFPFVVDNLN